MVKVAVSKNPATFVDVKATPTLQAEDGENFQRTPIEVIAKSAPTIAASPLVNVTDPLPVIATVANCWALTKVCGVEIGTPNDKSAGDTARVGLCAFDTTPSPARQQTAANTVIERTTTFHA